MSALVRALLIALAFFMSAPAFGRSAPLEMRAHELAQILQSAGDELDFFAPSFTAQVPLGQVRALADRLIGQHGAVIGVESITPRSASEASVGIGFTRARARFTLVIDQQAPHKVIGLWHVSSSARDDSAAKLSADFEALPGQSALLITPLSDQSARPIIALNPDTQMAVASSFKLWLLAEAARQVNAGIRAWNDVTRLGPPSLPSGVMQDWPRGSVVTLHTLATFAISISDNTASDTLFDVLGRSQVDMMVRRTGHTRSRALLSTIEAFALKMRSNQDLRQLWDRLDAPSAAQMLVSNAARLSLSSIDRAQLAGTPKFIDSVEWFASPRDMANTLDWIRLNAGSEARAILAINKGLPIGEASRFAYIGFKGGSEIGVFAMNYLVQARSGRWFAVTGSWNNEAAPVDEARFEALVSRAVALVP